jgi:hypothetical protein
MFALFMPRKAKLVPDSFSDHELEAYLDESLDPARASELEQACRADQSLIERLSMVNRRRDAGVHTLGEMWRRHQIGVPSTEQVADFLAGKLSQDHSDYIRFRMDVLKCRFTLALVEAAEQQKADSGEQTKSRREKYFQNSADLLPKK